MVRDECTVFRSPVHSVFNIIDFTDWDTVKIDHVASDVWQGCFLLKQKTAAFDTVAQGNGVNGNGAVFVNQSMARGIYGVKLNAEIQSLTKKPSRLCNMGPNAAGACTYRGAVRPNKPKVEMRPIKPKQWSPCRWEMNTWFSRENLSRERLIWSWALRRNQSYITFRGC